jgi:hypothetical protein
VLLDGQALYSLDRGYGRALCLQVGLEDINVVIEPLQILLFDGSDAFQHLAGVEDGLWISERIRGSGRGLAFDEVRVSVRTRKRSRLVPGT